MAVHETGYTSAFLQMVVDKYGGPGTPLHNVAELAEWLHFYK